MLKGPRFWYKDGWKSRALGALFSPFSLLYVLLVWLCRVCSCPKRHKNVKVIAVGGAVVGGSGKTTVAIEVARVLKDIGINAHIINRGYKKSNKFNEEVLSDDAFRYGDEAALLSKHARTWSGSDKNLLIEMAARSGAQAVILDDGIQSFYVHKDYQILVVDALQKFGNGMVMPAGPLREPLRFIKKRVDSLVIIGDKLDKSSMINGLRTFAVSAEESLCCNERRIAAFCGIGCPKKFHATLSRLGYDVVRFIEYPDHYAYKQSDVMYLSELSRQLSVPMVTTEKDYVKLPREFKRQVKVVTISVCIDGLEGELGKIFGDIKK